MPIDHIFVLMLENRSFDHMLGLSGVTGTDAVTGKPTQINGLSGTHSNSWDGVTCTAEAPAVDPMKKDPYHEFEDVLEQLCGHGAVYPPGGPYPAINNSGYLSNFIEKAGGSASPCDVMKSFAPPGSPGLTTPSLPVLTALAKEFAVCDAWYSSMPGPTWPNRFFALGASSACLDHSPSNLDIALWNVLEGFKFQHGSIFDVASGFLFWKRKLKWRIYAGNKLFTLAHALKGIHIWDIHRYSRFARHLMDPNYPAQFIWIEPNYGHVTSDYIGGNSQHPLDGITGGEALIKATYCAIRNSPNWETSMLVITWDEHGGFFDHAIPPRAVPPGDAPQFSGANKNGFAFDQYGPRVPAVIISPLIPANTIDHRPYDHASIPATLERLFNLAPLTSRDRAANDLRSIASLPVARKVDPAVDSLCSKEEAALRAIPLDGLEAEPRPPTRSEEPIELTPNLPGFLYLDAKTDAELPPARVAPRIHVESVQAQIGAITNRRQAHDYFLAVRKKVIAADSEVEA
ncbi:MAG TPA: alkaline phosphatase family protein [Candidatus Limnocylindrales bacterium]|nr:alkaline phosphatase family protein [Candidatus Limnocylindrales bacterium]